MCTTFFKLYRQKLLNKNSQNTSAGQIKFTIGFNRDICLTRPTENLGYFPEDNNIVGGKDLIGGGSWFLFNAVTGNIAFLTNLSSRYSKGHIQNAQSRGQVIYNFVTSDYYDKHPDQSIESSGLEYLKELTKVRESYNGFSIMVGNLKLENPTIHHMDFLSGEISEIEHDQWIGLSNSPISEPWKRVTFGLNWLNSTEFKNEDEFKEVMSKVLHSDHGADEILPYRENQININQYWAKTKTEWLRATSSHIILTVDTDNNYWVQESLVKPVFPKYDLPALQDALNIQYSDKVKVPELTKTVKNFQKVILKALTMLRAKKENSQKLKEFKTTLEGNMN